MRETNPEVKVGDRIQLLHMEDETGVSPLTKGTVVSVVNDPFEENSKIINVKWDNGSTLSLLTGHDIFKKVKDKLEEQSSSSGDPLHDYVKKNKEIFENFDWRFFRNFLVKLRDSGVVNMFQSPEFLYMGKERMDRYFGENQEDNESFQEVLDLADEAKFKMIQGTVKYMESKKEDIEIPIVSKRMESFAIKLAQLYMTLPLPD